jgi:hypothetical protein
MSTAYLTSKGSFFDGTPRVHRSDGFLTRGWCRGGDCHKAWIQFTQHRYGRDLLINTEGGSGPASNLAITAHVWLVGSC